MYEEDRKGSLMVKTFTVGKYIGVDLVQKGVKDGKEGEVKKEMILHLVHAAHLSTSLPLHPGVLDYPVLASLNPALQNVIVCKPVW